MKVFHNKKQDCVNCVCDSPFIAEWKGNIRDATKAYRGDVSTKELARFIIPHDADFKEL